MHAVLVLPANVQDRDGAKRLLTPLIGQMPRLKRLWADAGYTGSLVDWVRDEAGWVLEIVAKPPKATTFEVLPKRWIVERTLGWISHNRRLARDFERHCRIACAFVRMAMIRIMLRRLAPRPSA